MSSKAVCLHQQLLVIPYLNSYSFYIPPFSYIDIIYQNHKKIKTIDEFLIEVIREDGDSAWRDFSNKEEIIACVRTVIDTMRLYVSPEEIDQALGTLPRKIQEVLEPSPW